MLWVALGLFIGSAHHGYFQQEARSVAHHLKADPRAAASIRRIADRNSYYFAQIDKAFLSLGAAGCLNLLIAVALWAQSRRERRAAEAPLAGI